MHMAYVQSDFVERHYISCRFLRVLWIIWCWSISLPCNSLSCSCSLVSFAHREYPIRVCRDNLELLHLSDTSFIGKALRICFWSWFCHLREPKDILEFKGFICCCCCHCATIWALQKVYIKVKTCQSMKKDKNFRGDQKKFHVWVMKRTLEVWQVSSAIFTIDGYFQRVSWFWENPWELSSSLLFLFHNKAHTWEPVSKKFKHAPVWVFQNFMHLSSPPPPEASKLLWKGHQARAFIADVCSSSLWSHSVAAFEDAIDLSHMNRRLSLPPLANCRPEGDHLSPQTSCWWPL